MAVGDGTSPRQCIDFVNQSGLGAIGTPDDAIAQIQRLVAQSSGGFGCFLHLAHDWAAPAARLRSYDLFARHVAPHFQGQHQPTADARTRAREARPALAQDNLKAVAQATARYQSELEAKKR